MSLANNVSNVLKNIRNNADEEFKKVYMVVKEKFMSLYIEIPRVTNIQKNINMDIKVCWSRKTKKCIGSSYNM